MDYNDIDDVELITLLEEMMKTLEILFMINILI